MTTTQNTSRIVTEDGETVTVYALPLSHLVQIRRVSREGDELDEMFLHPDEVRAFVLTLLAAANTLDGA